MVAILKMMAQMVIKMVTTTDYFTISWIKSKVPYSQADERTRRIYDEIKHDLGFTNGGISSLTSGYPDLMAAFFSLGRENFIVGNIERSQKETALGLIAFRFRCFYCVGMHSMFCGPNIRAIVNNDIDSIKDPEVREFVQWISDAADFEGAGPKEAPFGADMVPEVIGMFVASSTLGRVANIFMRKSPLHLNTTSPIKQAIGMMRPGIEALIPELERGTYLPMSPTPSGTFPEHLRWTDGDDVLRQVFWVYDETVENYTKDIANDAVKTAARKAYADWATRTIPLGEAWIDEYTAGFEANDAAVLRYLLLAGLAPERVMGKDIKEMDKNGTDHALFLATWASYFIGLAIGKEVEGRIQIKEQFRPALQA